MSARPLRRRRLYRRQHRAARRRGKWLGGTPVLGYDVHPQTRQLVVHPEEAERVRAIFRLYLELQGLIPTVRELSRRGWVAKRWTTRKGVVLGGRPFNKASLHFLLTNVTYPRAARLMALAIRLEELIRSGHVPSYAALARLVGVSRARVTQIANLTLLAPDIQEAILFLPPVVKGPDPITERDLRPIVAEPDWVKQRRLWESLTAPQPRAAPDC